MPALLWVVLGGCRSGKSRQAQEIATSLAGDARVIYVATCRTQGLDPEMEARVSRHRNERPAAWSTIENEFDLGAIASRHAGEVILLDCLTLWLSHWLERDTDVDSILSRLDQGLDAMRSNGVQLVVVSNEVGSGVVPVDADTRSWRDLVGFANQQIARQAEEVDWMVAGIPTRIRTQGDRS